MLGGGLESELDTGTADRGWIEMKLGVTRKAGLTWINYKLICIKASQR